MSWTPERIEVLKKLWGEGLSCEQIAYRLHGTTRNAVIGKLHRLGLSVRSVPDRMKSKHSPLRGRIGSGSLVSGKFASAKTKAARAESGKRFHGDLFDRHEATPLPPRHETDIARVSFADLEAHHCRFIPGNPQSSGPMFCGAQKVPGLSYCEHHARRCFDGLRNPTRVNTFGVITAPLDATKAVDELLEDKAHA